MTAMLVRNLKKNVRRLFLGTKVIALWTMQDMLIRRT
jgi:hypothetical protein